MDQVVEVARHPSSKGVYYKVHLFLHHLHLSDYVRWNYVGNRWVTRVLLFWPTWNITSFQPFLVPSLSADAFLVFLLNIKVCVLLT